MFVNKIILIFQGLLLSNLAYATPEFEQLLEWCRDGELVVSSVGSSEKKESVAEVLKRCKKQSPDLKTEIKLGRDLQKLYIDQSIIYQEEGSNNENKEDSSSSDTNSSNGEDVKTEAESCMDCFEINQELSDAKGLQGIKNILLLLPILSYKK